ncbi:MAG: hypothetical protein ACXWZM_03390, partial [Solirubrobacterales bacterium]
METITEEHPTVEPGGSEEPRRAPNGPPVPPHLRRSPPRAALKTARPHEWIKNVLVFAGLLFSGQFNDAHA